MFFSDFVLDDYSYWPATVRVEEDHIQLDVPGAIPASVRAVVEPFDKGVNRLAVTWKRVLNGKETPYRRVFTLSTKVDTKAITGKLEQGVLTLTLPVQAVTKEIPIDIPIVQVRELK